MPHVSKQKINTKIKEEIEMHLINLLVDSSTTTRKRLLKELFTATERTMLAKRLALISLISQGKSTHKIAEALGVSPSTVQRFERRVGMGEYKNAEVWLKKNVRMQKILELLADALSPMITGKRKTFREIVET